MAEVGKYNKDPMSFPKFDKDQKPLIIDVANGRWNAYSQNSPPTPQDEVLLNLLEAIGGVSMSTSPGRYHFNVTGLSSEKIEIQISPIRYK